ncbi:VCBS domain-containing protein [Bradyrhizobium sp. WU425]|uniref:VCBS domain-containing protein n=1 Tax=Bradyrhizobium sp. WU425 TaxID=187029 RepID=UPI001E3F226F|nr:VCBS domain-containing protein [Bradyrhizobium canariense]UFW70725.1 VCBS domain-containing protein [Bradyrhizobium canariense]
MAPAPLDADDHADRHQRQPVAVADTNSAVAGPTTATWTINADGSYSFEASNAAYQHLAEGATQVVVANYTVTDEHGASAPRR